LNEAGDQVAYAPLNDRDRDRPQPALHAAAQHDPFLKPKPILPGENFKWPTTFKTLTWSPRIFAGRIASSRSARRSRASTATPSSCAIRWAPAGSPAAAVGQQRNYNFDATAMEGLDRFDAALGAVTMPKTERWLGLTVYDKDLARQPNVQRWLEHATDRCGIACTRRRPISASRSEDRRALGCYGTGALWADEVKGKSLFFLAIHMSQVWIDVDFRGQVDTVHRKMELTARQAAELVGKDALSPKMAEAYADPKKIDSSNSRSCT
jgi:hypothetical protein